MGGENVRGGVSGRGGERGGENVRGKVRGGERRVKG